MLATPESQSAKIMEETRKKVDEEWKQKVEQEKQEPKEEGKFIPPQPDFKFFITTLALQASISLGFMENPETKETKKDPSQAKFIIDTLGMLQDKTKGNLSAEETQLLENLLYELRTAYLSAGEPETK